VGGSATKHPHTKNTPITYFFRFWLCCHEFGPFVAHQKQKQKKKKKKKKKKKEEEEEEEVIASLQYCMGSQSKEKTQ
jgi:hypothetical protein